MLGVIVGSGMGEAVGVAVGTSVAAGALGIGDAVTLDGRGVGVGTSCGSGPS